MTNNEMIKSTVLKFPTCGECGLQEATCNNCGINFFRENQIIFCSGSSSVDFEGEVHLCLKCKKQTDTTTQKVN